jgi:hypothetical protein
MAQACVDKDATARFLSLFIAFAASGELGELRVDDDVESGTAFTSTLRGSGDAVEGDTGDCCCLALIVRHWVQRTAFGQLRYVHM